MSRPSRYTRFKIVAGYLLLLLVIVFSLLFIHRELENLSVLDTNQVLKADSLLILLREKDENTIRMLKALSEANEKLLSIEDLEQIIARQDTIITQQRVQHKITTSRDSIIAPTPKKGFFKRLAEAFVPPKDTTMLVSTTLEIVTDTLLNEYNPTDSLQQRIKEVGKQRLEDHRAALKRNNARLRRMNSLLTARIDSLVREYQTEIIRQATEEAENQRAVRRRSTLTIGAMAVGAILLSAVFLIIIWRDIARSNRYRRELEAANRRSEELLKARENLMLTITHDFKAPLSSIIGYIELLEESTKENNRQAVYLNNMKASSDHLLKLVTDLLDFHRLDLNKAEVNRIRFNPATLFNEIYISFKSLTTGKGLSFRNEPDSLLNGFFIGDPLRIQQIVNNLLSNAIKFTPAGGSITLQTRYQQSTLWITITDTGKGMPPEDRERIFMEFTRLPNAQGEEGFGLGLSIVKKLIHLLEGSITVESEPGKGSCFTVQIPLYPVAGKVEQKEVSPELPAGKTLNPLKVLLIDDDKIQLNLTSAMLKQNGLEAVCCEQPDELIDHLRNETFDVLLTDVQMPAINGFDLLKLLRASNIPQAQTIPIIAVTARSEMNGHKFIESGFAGYLHKPFRAADLLKILAKPQPNFAALTAFSAGDEEAAQNIMQSFVVETRKNIETLQQALDNKDMDGITALAHKLLPLFTLIEAGEVVSMLAELEKQRGKSFTSEAETKVKTVIILIEKILNGI